MIISRCRTLSFQWHFNQGEEIYVSGAEYQQVSQAPGKQVMLETKPLEARRYRPGRYFEAEQAMWRRFCQKHAIKDCQLGLELRTVRSPVATPPGVHRLPPEWSISLTLPTQSQGSVLFSRAVNGGRFPSRLIMGDLLVLRRLPRLRPGPKRSLLIRGDLLLQFLGSALEHLRERSVSGIWKLAGGRPVPAPAERRVDGERDDAEWSLTPLLPASHRFVPHQTVSGNSGLWRAVHYDADQRMLIGKGPASNDWAAVALSKPLYRYFTEMIFTRDIHQTVISGENHIMPSAILEL